jgi:hypothetical protein
MITDIIAFIFITHSNHWSDHHNTDFEVCQRTTCKRARQLEVYLQLTGQWVEAAYGWLAVGGRG